MHFITAPSCGEVLVQASFLRHSRPLPCIYLLSDRETFAASFVNGLRAGQSGLASAAFLNGGIDAKADEEDDDEGEVLMVVWSVIGGGGLGI